METAMKGEVGDRIAILSRQQDESVRECEIVGVHGTDGGPPYAVRWLDTGHFGIFFPGSDARVVHDAAARTRHGLPDVLHAEEWEVTVAVAEYDGGKTKAHVVAYTGERAVQAYGQAQRLPGDIEIPQVGAEVAAGRAFISLGEELLAQSTRSVEDVGPQ
jgi:hypothetical protein